MTQGEAVLQVLVVDDSPQIRRAITSIVVGELDPVKVVVAENGVRALEKIASSRFDLIVLDLSMPEMDGFTFLRLLRTRSDTPVLVVSSLKDIIYVERALEMGANAFMGKPGDFFRNEARVREEFREKLKKLLPREVWLGRARARIGRDVSSGNADHAQPAARSEFGVVVIGCSSGGPPTLQYLLSGIPQEISAAVIIAQHMPKGFTAGMVERLKRMLKLRIREAADGEEVVSGEIYFCPGGVNMRIEKVGGTPVFIARQPGERDISPNVDMLFESAADVFGKRLMGIVLTGMGRDGSEGVKRIKARGGMVLAESDETATIFGMPKEAAATGCVDNVLALPDISVELIRKVAPS